MNDKFWEILKPRENIINFKLQNNLLLPSKSTGEDAPSSRHTGARLLPLETTGATVLLPQQHCPQQLCPCTLSLYQFSAYTTMLSHPWVSILWNLDEDIHEPRDLRPQYLQIPPLRNRFQNINFWGDKNTPIYRKSQ
jgi:hypothetical protein